MRSALERVVRASAGPVLITGGSGFVATALIAALAPAGNVRVSRRRDARAEREIAVGELGRGADWRRALEGVDSVVHLAGPAHAALPEEVIRRGVVGGTAELVEQAAGTGVRRFIYMSSIKACAEDSTGAPLNEDDPPRPRDAYGRAKLEAEQIVLERRSLAPIVLRPPLVYAPHAKANFARLMRWCDTDLPLPFAGIHSRRSLIALSSLVDAIVAVMRKEDAPTGVFHLADEPAVSIAEMVTLLRQGMGRPARLFALPAFTAIAPPALVHSLEVDGARFRAAFGHAGVDTREGLVACGRAWRQRR